MTLAEARDRIGARVFYRAHGTYPTETGQITSVNDTYVFVRYDGDEPPKAEAETTTFYATSKATRPEDLSFILERAP